MEGVAQLDKVRLLARGFVIDAPAHHGVVGDKAGDKTAHARQRGNRRASVGGLYLEQRSFIGDHLQRLAHVVGLALVARHDADEFILGARDGIVTRRDRRQLPHVLRHVGEEFAHHRKTFLFVSRCVVDGAGVIDRYLVPAEFVLGEFLAEAALHHRRPGGKDRCVLHHHRP